MNIFGVDLLTKALHTPLVSIIVLNYNGSDHLADCLPSLHRQSYPHLEIIVADNGSTDSSEMICRQHQVTFLGLKKNYGFSIANNRGASVAKGKHLFFVNNDMRFDEHCVEHMVTILERDARVFSVDATQYDWEGISRIHGRVELRRTRKFFGTFWPFVEQHVNGVAEGPVEVPQGCAGNLMVRRWMFDALGGFDETFFIDYEDTDLCWRAWMRGWKSVYVPSAILWHKVGQAFSDRGSVEKKAMEEWRVRRRLSNVKNQTRFFFKAMPWKMVLLLTVREHLRVFWHLIIQRDLETAGVYLRGYWGAVSDLPEIFKERMQLSAKAVWSSKDLLRRFVR